MKHPFQISFIRLSPESKDKTFTSVEECKCIIFCGPEAEQEELRDLLGKIINATGLDKQKETIQIKTTPESSPGFSEIRNHLPPVPILCFGIKPQRLGLQINHTYMEAFEFAGFTWLFSPSLKELSEDKRKKLKLWSALKQLFELKPEP